jgi:hypothetical protein
MHAVEDLDGTNIARARADADTCQITILAASGFSGDKYYPAESITVSGVQAIADLHNLCGRLLEANAEAAQAGDPS